MPDPTHVPGFAAAANGRSVAPAAVEKAAPGIRLPGQLTREIGVPGTPFFGGNIIERDPALREIVGPRWRMVAREMRETDATVAACVDLVIMLSRRAEWRVEPPDETPVAQEAADFLHGALFDDMSHTWQDFLTDALGMVEQGWSFCEVVYKVRLGPEQRDPAKRSRFSDGKIGVRKIVGRDQLTLREWRFDASGGLQAMVQYDPSGGYNGIEIPIDRALLFRTTRERGSPEGRSLLAACAKAWWRKRNIEAIEAVGIERDLTGVPVVTGPFSSTKDDTERSAYYEAAKRLATQVRFNEQGGITLDSATYTDPVTGQLTNIPQWGITLISTPGGRSVDTEKVLARYDSQIMRRFFADFLLLGQSGRGSFALSKSKVDVFAAATGWLLDVVRDAINRHLVPKLWALNGFDYELMPRIEHGDIAPEDLQELGAYIQAMAAAGAPIGAHVEIVNALLRLGHLPEVPEEDPRTILPAAEDIAAPGETDEELTAADAEVPP